MQNAIINNFKCPKKAILLIFVLLLCISSFSQNDIFDVCRKGSLDDITKLYNDDKDVINTKNKNGYSALTLACYSGNNDVVAFLIDKVKSVNGNSKYGSPLMAATVKGNVNIVKLLLSYKADVSIADANKTTALHYAVMFKNKQIIQMLIDANANVNIKDANGKSALDHAEIIKDEAIIKILKN